MAETASNLPSGRLSLASYRRSVHHHGSCQKPDVAVDISTECL